MKIDPKTIAAALGKGCFRHMRLAERRALVEHVRASDDDAIAHFRAGDLVFAPGAEADRMYVVLSGRFEERAGADETAPLLWEADPGENVGEVSLFARSPDGAAPGQPLRETALRCVEDGALLVIREAVANGLVREGGAFAEALVRGLATDAWRMILDEKRDREVERTYFAGHTASLTPAPYACSDVVMHVFCCVAPDETFDPYLPPRVHAPLGTFFLLVFAEFGQLSRPGIADAPTFRYNETALFVPALVRGNGQLLPRPYFFVPALYPDNFMAVILGREIFGFRKRTARTTFIEGPGDRADQVRLQVDGRQVARVRYRPARTDLAGWLASDGDDARRLREIARVLHPDLWLRLGELALTTAGGAAATLRVQVPTLNWKQIPGADHSDARADFDVNALTLAPFGLTAIRSVSLVDAHDLHMAGPIPFEGARLLCPVGFRVDCDFDLLTGRPVLAYGRHETLDV